VPAALLAAGIATVAAVSMTEAAVTAESPWAEAVLVLDAPVPEEEAGEVYPAAFRELHEESLPEPTPFVSELTLTPQGGELVAALGLDRHERVVCADLPGETMELLLASGRLPEPGAGEVLAGDLARFDSFTLDGLAFRTVGRLRRGIGGLAFAYLLPGHETVTLLFSLDAGATRGWIAPQGLTAMETDDESPVEMVGGITRTTPGLAVACIAGLVLVAAGGALAQIRLLRYLAAKRRGPLAAVLHDISQHGALLWAIHLLLYGLFFGGMLAALQHPVANLRLATFVAAQFVEGDLGYIGAAYASGNVLKAAAATFAHNYLVATVGLTILPSLFIPLAGLLKNIPTFGFIGFVMSPMWTGASRQLVYHAITMTLELEAYIVACFVITMWPVRLIRGLARDHLGTESLRGLRAVLEGALLAGIMLAIAALYEAATVISFR